MNYYTPLRKKRQGKRGWEFGKSEIDIKIQLKLFKQTSSLKLYC